jgi:hypothetical protein
MVRITISLRDYVYSKIFPIDQEIPDINKSARIEELISKGLDAERKTTCQNENKK